MKLATYQNFLDRVDELGFMLFMSSGCRTLPVMFEEASNKGAWTGDPDIDPWCWKDRAAEEKKLAYGCILGGQKGFVSARMYPYFYIAYQPEEFMEERWASGLINQTTWQLWQLFEKKNSLDTSEIRREMGVTRKSGGSRVDASILELQRDYYITVAGHRCKVNRHGQPYGWPSCIYELVTSWAPADWLTGISSISPEEAREKILDVGMAMGKFSSREDLADALCLESKLK